jgi:hypothetical protein
LQDAPSKDVREGRNAAENIVPTTTGAAIAVTLTLPQLKNKFDGLSIRVPTPVVSLSDVTALLKRPVTVEELNEAFKKAAAQPYFQGVLGVSEEPLVSSDYIGNSYSGIVDLLLTKVVDGNLVKVMVWYDNEWGYSNRLVELVADVCKALNGADTATGAAPASTSGEEKKLDAPSTEDFLPAQAQPNVGQVEGPHMSSEEHQPVEGLAVVEPAADPAMTTDDHPQQPPDTNQQPHNF